MLFTHVEAGHADGFAAASAGDQRAARRSKEQLSDEAKLRDVRGRSKMTKAESQNALGG